MPCGVLDSCTPNKPFHFLAMWKNPNQYRSRHYTVCSCQQWIWTDRIKARPRCNCGKAFKIDPSHNHKAPGSEQRQLHKEQGGPKDIQTQFNGFLQTLLASLPAAKRQQMQKEFPTLQEAGKAQKPKEPFRQASDDASKAFREFKRLGEKKHSIETRAAKLQKELERCSEELAETTHLLDRAQAEHQKHIRTFAEVVQPKCVEVEADISDEDRPAEGCEEDITGDEQELDGETGRKRQKVERRAWNRATRETSGTQQQQQQQDDSMQDTQREPQTDSEWLQDQETEEFQGFKSRLTDDQRIVLERQMQLAVQRARDAAGASSSASGQQPKQQQQQQTKQEGLGAKDLMAASKLLGAFAEALQTKPVPEHG